MGARRRCFVAATVAIGLFVPTGSAATAADGSPSPTTKRERLEELHGQPVRTPAPTERGAGGRLGGLAAQRDSDRVVLSVKVRGGAGAAKALTEVSRSATAQGGVQRRMMRQLATVSVEVPKADAASMAAALRQRPDVEHVDIVSRRTLTFVPNDEKYSASAPYLEAVNAPLRVGRAAW